MVCTLPMLLAAASAATAPLEGRVTVRAAPPARAVAAVTDSRFCGVARTTADLQVSPGGGLANAVVSLEDPPADGGVFAPAEVEVKQSGCTFVPHVAVLRPGGALRFVNEDPLAHQIRVVGAGGASFNAMQRKNVVMTRRFETAGEFPVRCDVHPWMSAVAVVARHRFYAVTDEDGYFSLDAPAGRYHLRIWHEQLGELRAVIETGTPGSFSFAGPEVTVAAPAAAPVVPAAQTHEPPADIAKKLKSLQQLRDQGVLSPEEYRRMVDLLIGLSE